MERGWEARSVSRKRPHNGERAERVVNRLCKMFGQERVSKKIYHMFMDDQSGLDKSKYYVRYFFKSPKTYDKHLFEHPSSVELFGRKYMAPTSKEEFLSKTYGAAWKNKKIPAIKYNPYRRIISTEISAEEFIDTVISKGYDMDSIWSMWRERNRAYIDIKEMSDEIDHYWEVMVGAGERYRLADEYNPKLDVLEELYQNGDDESLAEAMEDYVNTLVNLEKKNVIISVNDKLDSLGDFALINAGKGKIASKIRNGRTNSTWKKISMISEEKRDD